MLENNEEKSVLHSVFTEYSVLKGQNKLSLEHVKQILFVNQNEKYVDL